jgi:hypothetical protein
MALKNGKPNPLNLLDLRRVDFPARHFHYTNLEYGIPDKAQLINEWIFNNLNGRYYLGKKLILDNTNSIRYVTALGFEEEKELSFFLLSYSDL